MARELKVVDAGDVIAVMSGVRRALKGEGPAVMPYFGVPDDLETEVDDDVAIVIETSGSTSKPKRVALSADGLRASADAAYARLGGTGDWLLAVPTNYIAGVNVLVRAIVAGTAVNVMAGLADGSGVERFVRACATLTHTRRYVSLVPVQLARLLESPDALEPLRRFDRILVGGQAMPAGLTERALEAGLNVSVTYGSTETCGGCVWDGAPIGDTQLEIVDGRIEIASSSLALGYLGAPRRTAAAFHERHGRRWYRTDDLGDVTGGILTVQGRVDDLIASGGVKVSLAEVEAEVRGIPAFEQAVVVAVPHPEWGEVPVVVSTAGMPLEDLRARVAAALGPAAAPHRLLQVDAIPLLPSGKPDRLAIVALARTP